MSKGFKISMGILGLFILAIIIFVIIAPREEQPITPQKQSDKETHLNILKYKVVKKVRYRSWNTMVHRIILEVAEFPTEDQMKETAIHIWENGNKNWNTFSVFLYLPGMNVKRTAYGRGQFNPNGMESFITQDSALNGTNWMHLKQVKQANILKYSVLNIGPKNSGYGTCEIALEVEKLPTKVQMEKIARHIWKKNNKKIETIFMYLPGMNVKGTAYGRGQFNPNGMEFFITQDSALNGTRWEEFSPKEIKVVPFRSRERVIEGSVRLSLEKRKEIYYALTTDPLWKYDDDSDRIPIKLGEKYMRKYNLTKSELAKILFEGAEKYW